MKIKDIMTGEPRTCSPETNLARKRVRDAEVVGTLQAICAHHHPSPHIAAA